MERRDFIRAAGVAGSAAALAPQWLFASAQRLGAADYIAMHPFVTAHPEAVFVQRTAAASRTDDAAKLSSGKALAQQLFAPAASGMPMSTRFALKPNLTCLNGDATEERLGIVTDPGFMEGWIEGLKANGVAGENIYMREGNLISGTGCPSTQGLDWYAPLAERTGTHLTHFDSGRDMTQRGVTVDNLEEGSEVVWREVPDGVVYRRVGYLAPINADDAFNVNIAKFKAHSMGMTLTAKNWQGTNITPQVHYCSSVPRQLDNGLPASDLNPNYREDVTRLFEEHLEAGVPRWDRPGTIDKWNSGPGMTTWMNKTLDNHVASRPGLHIIEGIYGRDGNWMKGPHGGKSQDFMTNIVLFGTNPFLVDIIGFYLSGHEPGNIGLFHGALGRGLIDRLNPHSIPVYDWNDGAPLWTGPDAFERTPLKTYSMQRDYAGQNEPEWHLMDEPYEYHTPTAVTDGEAQPQVMALGQNFPNPFNASTLIEYRLPHAGRVRVEVFNSVGQRVDVLVDAHRAAGAHTVAWDASRRASGSYTYRLLTEGFSQTRSMVLVR